MRRGLSISTWEINQAVSNLTIVGDLVTDQAVKVLANISVDLLAHSQYRVPHKTGALKGSGRALIKFGKGRSGGYTKIVGKGTTDVEGGVTANLGGLKGRSRGASFITGVVTYARTNKLGQNIALWAHEELLPFSARPTVADLGFPRNYRPYHIWKAKQEFSDEEPFIAKPAYASKEGRGPKYLYNPFKERSRLYTEWIFDVFSYSQTSKMIRSRMNVAKIGSEYTVDIVKLRR